MLDLQGLVRSGFFSLASGASTRIGFREAREFAWIFYNRRIARLDRDAHAVDKNYAVGELLGFDDGPLDLTVATTADDRRHAAALLRGAGIRQQDDTAPARYAVLVPTTRWETKCWPLERFGQLARLLQQRHGLPSVLVGGPDDVEAGRRAAEASALETSAARSQPQPNCGTGVSPAGPQAERLCHNSLGEPRGCSGSGVQGDAARSAANLCGRTTLRQLAAVIDGASIVITADSTPMHMAAAHDRPLVALFGPTNPDRTGPYGRLDDVLLSDIACSPCYLRKRSQCPHDHACMRDLAVEQVAEAVARRIEPLQSGSDRSKVTFSGP